MRPHRQFEIFMNIGLIIKNPRVYQTFMAIKQKLFILQNSSWYQIKDKFVYNIMKSLNSVKLLKVSREIDFFFSILAIKWVRDGPEVIFNRGVRGG